MLYEVLALVRPVAVAEILLKDTDDVLMSAGSRQVFSLTVLFLSLSGGRNFCRIWSSAFGGLPFPSTCYTICSVLQVQM